MCAKGNRAVITAMQIICEFIRRGTLRQEKCLQSQYCRSLVGCMYEPTRKSYGTAAKQLLKLRYNHFAKLFVC